MILLQLLKRTLSGFTGRNIHFLHISLKTKYRSYAIMLHCCTPRPNEAAKLVLTRWLSLIVLESSITCCSSRQMFELSRKSETACFSSLVSLAKIGTSEHAAPTVTRQLQSTETTRTHAAAAHRLMMLKTGAPTQFFISGNFFPPNTDR